MNKKGFIGLIIWIIILFLVISAIFYVLSKPVNVDRENSTSNESEILDEEIVGDVPSVVEVDSNQPSTG